MQRVSSVRFRFASPTRTQVPDSCAACHSVPLAAMGTRRMQEAERTAEHPVAGDGCLTVQCSQEQT